jgi:hypothetical protein
VHRPPDLDHREVLMPGRSRLAGPAPTATARPAFHRPAVLVHRAAPTEPAFAAPPREPRPAAEISARETVDVDALGRDLWRRFDRQMRVEMQRRGRG